jgi:hypothetical protein
MEIQTEISNDDRLFDLMKQEMNEEEQHLFIESFKSYLKYGNDDKSFVINLDDVWKWMGFSQKTHAKRLFVKYFTENINYNILLSRSGEQDNSKKHGGNNKETIMMTVNTFKKFCMKASTQRADQICDYYLKMENIMHKYTQEKLIQINNLFIESETNTEKERHKVLLKSNSKRPLVYTLKLMCSCDDSDRNAFFLKIGFTDDIQSRVNKIKEFFKCDIIALDLFPCSQNKAFERFLFNNEKIMNMKYEKIINNANKSTEVLLVKSINEYNTIKRIIEKNIYQYHSKSLDEKKVEVILKLIDIFKDDKEGLLKAFELTKNMNDDDIEIPIPKDESNPIEVIKPVTEITKPLETTKFCGPKVQLYDGNNINNLLMVIESITDATRKIEKSSFTHIKFAATNKLLYLGYRWHLIDRNDPNPNEVKNIGDTRESVKRTVDFIAMLNIEKTKILKVFKLQKDAAKHISQHTSAVCSALKYQNPLAGYYWSFWKDLSENIKNDYTQSENLPDNLKNIRGISINKIDPNTNNIIQTYPSIVETVKELHISPRKLKEICKTNEIFRGFIYKSN